MRELFWKDYSEDNMDNMIGLGVFGTFGQPFGFQQYFYYDLNFNKSLDLNPNAIEVYPNSELYSVNRCLSGGKYMVCFSIYTYARELNSSRGGTFIGSSVVLLESYIEAICIYKVLKELHQDVINNEGNVKNDCIQVDEAVKLNVREPFEFLQAKSKVRKISENNYHKRHNDSKFLIRSDNGVNYEAQVISFFERAMNYYVDVDTLYFTSNDLIINNVRDKGLIKILDWNAFISQNQGEVSQYNIFTKKLVSASDAFDKKSEVNYDYNDGINKGNIKNDIQQELLKSSDGEIDALKGSLRKICDLMEKTNTAIINIVDDANNYDMHKDSATRADMSTVVNKYLKLLVNNKILIFVLLLSGVIAVTIKESAKEKELVVVNDVKEINKASVDDVVIRVINVYMDEGKFIKYAEEQYLKITDVNQMENDIAQYLMQNSSFIKDKYRSNEELRDFIEYNNKVLFEEMKNYLMKNSNVKYSDSEISKTMSGELGKGGRLLIYKGNAN